MKENYEFKGKNFRLKSLSISKLRLTSTVALVVDSDQLEDIIEFLQVISIDSIIIKRPEYKLNNIKFIQDIKFLRGIYIPSFPYPPEIDFSAIETCSWLRHLSLPESTSDFNLSQLSNLIGLGISKAKSVEFPQAENMKFLSISYTRNKDLAFLPKYENLEELSVYHGSIVSLSGIEQFENLKLYQHCYGKSLNIISPITKLHRLEELRFENCRKLQVESVFEQCDSIKRLFYLHCPDLPSLSFLNFMKNIEDFRFCDINILDGDLTPLLQLEDFGFYPNKRNYSHTEEELRKIKTNMQ